MTVKKHKHAIENLRRSLAELTDKKRQVKAQIHTLRTDASGKRRPETGSERDQLWQSYVWSTRPLARATHLALGMLRGTPYSAMEPRNTEGHGPPLYGVLKAIHTACGEDETLKAEWTLERIQKLVEAASTAKEAA